MTMLFSPFDNFYFNLFLYSNIFLILMFFNFYFKISLYQLLFTNFNLILKFFLSLKPKNYSNMSMILIFSIFMQMIVLNFSSVLPFIYPATTQFGVILIFSMSIWISFIFVMTSKNLYGFLSHLVPEGCPIFLSTFLFAVELISNFIRPLTLSVRISANILSGHLLMILLSKLVYILPPVFLFYSFLCLIEMFVALIQSYIFCTMILLYFSEVN